MLSVLGIFCLQELVVWIMWSLYWKFCVLEIFCYFVKVDSVHSCIGNFLFAEISCVDYVGSELRIFYLQKFLVWIM